jgi:hypothetical protein
MPVSGSTGTSAVGAVRCTLVAECRPPLWAMPGSERGPLGCVVRLQGRGRNNPQGVGRGMPAKLHISESV